MPKIIVQRGDDVREIDLAKDTFSIGRTPENDLELKDSLISRRHSSIVRRGEEFHVYDLGSSNGTYVNQEKIEVRVLKDGDQVRIGETLITFRDENNPREEVLPKPFSPPTPASPLGGLNEPTMRVQHVSEIAESFQLDFTEALEKGMSIVDARPQVEEGKAQEERNLFFILFQVCKELSQTSTLQELLENSMKLIFEVINCERGVILTLKDGKLVPGFAYHRERGVIPGREMNTSSTILNKIILEKVAVATDDAQHDDRFEQGMSIVQFNIRSVVAAPIWEQQGVLGAIYLDNVAKTHAFTEDDQRLLTAIANLVALRMKQEELNEKLRQEMVARDNLSKYHSPDVVEMIMQRGGEIGLEVEEREVTVLFADVVASTKLAEEKRPEHMAALLNDFFEMATGAIFTHKGSVNNFIGDEVMAIFNAPVDQEDHSLSAVKVAEEIL
ncbi:MAG: FHA domain-containing protein, partial [Planctomycetota bacterium]|nr:FHA domain-containing protein [Planctomycetota bacterium]